MALFPSEAWASEWLALADNSERFRQASQGWEGDVGCIITADVDRGLREDACLWFRPRQGRIEDQRYGDRASAESATIVLLGPYASWKRIVTGTLNPVKAIVQNKITVRGRLGQLRQFVGAINELQRLATHVPTQFTDGDE